MALEIMLSQSFLLLLLPLLTHPLSNSNFTISLWQVSMALIRAVPPFTDWASILAPMSKSIFTISSWGRGGMEGEEEEEEEEGGSLHSYISVYSLTCP